MFQKEIEKQLIGAKNLFYGTLKGVDSRMNIPMPDFVYHYTSIDKFSLIVESDTIRFYTVANFVDNRERNLTFDVEEKIKGSIGQESIGMTTDFGPLICAELSKDQVFVLSTSIDNQNKYLWQNYADGGKGLCLKLSTKHFIKYLNSTLPNFQIMPDYFKCLCHIIYESDGLNQFLELLANTINKINDDLRFGRMIFWFFLVEYWRNFLKARDPYKQEKEFRLVISNNYSLYLTIYGILAAGGNLRPKYPKNFPKFLEESQKYKMAVHNNLNFKSDNGVGFVTIPLYSVLNGILVGPNCSLSKTDISVLSRRRIRKSTITKSFADVG